MDNAKRLQMYGYLVGDSRHGAIEDGFIEDSWLNTMREQIKEDRSLLYTLLDKNEKETNQT